MGQLGALPGICRRRDSGLQLTTCACIFFFLKKKKLLALGNWDNHKTTDRLELGTCDIVIDG